MSGTKITIKNVISFVTGHTLHAIDTSVSLPLFIQEQINYRKQVCADCLKLGQCPICHCPLPEKFYSYSPCDGMKYPFLMSKKEWNKYKINNNIDLP